MIETGWGQVPVRESEKGRITGIVTRTDLINAIGTQIDRTPEHALRDRLEKALPPSRLSLLKLVSSEAENRGDALYIVGGFVRDLLLGAPSVDFDLVVEGDAIGLAEALISRFGGRISSHRRFGTAKWHLDPQDEALNNAVDQDLTSHNDLPETLDFVTARTEFYTHPTALPSVQRGSIKLDLHRRDFTINTLAIRLDGPYFGQLLDHWGGRRDLEDGKIRVLHSISFIDDPTRILRAIRLENRLDFEIETRTLALLTRAVPLLDRVSGERIRHELETIFDEHNFTGILLGLHDRGLLKAIHPHLVWDAWLEERFDFTKSFDPPASWNLQAELEVHDLLLGLWLFRLERVYAEEICHRLKLPISSRDNILSGNELGRLFSGEMKFEAPSEFVALFDAFTEEALVNTWLGLDAGRNEIEEYLAKWRHIKPLSSGDVLRDMNLPQGPQYGRILWTIRAAWLDGEISSAEEERVLLEELVKKAI
jgi:tRNA nucleotidyltransferase (CCA-adding enzyme)